MGIFSRIVDAVDNTVTDARGRHAAERDARRATAHIREGDTVWVTNTHHTLMGDQDLTVPLTVGRGRRVGSSSLAGLVLRNGSLSTTRPRGVMTVEEFDAQQVAPPAFPNPTKDQAKTRVKAGAHR